MNPDTMTGSSEPDPRRNRIDRAFETVAKLSGTDATPSDFFQDFLKMTLEAIDAPAGAIWLRNPQGFLQLQCQTNIENVGLDKHKNGRQSHNELLRQAFTTGKPILLEPYGSTGIMEGIPAGNPTDLVVLLAPISLDEKNIVGLVEVWQEPRHDARAKRTHLNFLVQMAGYAASYFRTQQGRQTVNLEQFWTQLEAFSCQIHASLDPTVVSYHVANEGRRLIQCDRISVATREGKKAKIEAVSGSDVVEKRAAQIKLMRALCEAVFKWDEKLVYRGVKDDGLPPDVYDALDAYLAESSAKLLVVQPLRDPREKDKETKEYKPGKSRSAILMECFEPPAQPDPIISRLDVIGRHAGSALYNATQLHRIPLKVLWKPILAVQEGLGGRARFLTMLGTIAVTLFILAMVFVPWELKMDAKGELLPVERRSIFAPHAGNITRIVVDRDSKVRADQVLMEAYDPELHSKLQELTTKIVGADSLVKQLQAQSGQSGPSVQDRQKVSQDLIAARFELESLSAQRSQLLQSYQSNSDQPGTFVVRAPNFLPGRLRSRAPEWVVLSGNDFKSELQGRFVKPSDPLLRIGDRNGEWELEVKIPQRHIGQVFAAYQTDNLDEELDVDIKLESQVTERFRGRLARRKIGSEAIPNKDDHNETEPVVHAYVRISGADIPEDMRMPEHLYLAGVGAKVKVRCGQHPMGYSLFYGVWEFLNEKIFYLF